MAALAMALATELRGSLRNRLILLCSAMALLAALLIGGMYHQRASSLAAVRAVEKLEASVRLASLQLIAPFTEMRHDAISVSRTPPIAGIIRARSADGYDRADGSSMTQWRVRLETIFESVMAERPHYTQMRYVGVADGGRELVRVNRRAGRLERVPPSGLQTKGHRDYFIEALSLKPAEVLFSRVSANIEHRRTDSAGMPTIRVIVPVLAEDDGLFGMVVINADVEAMMRGALEELELTEDAFIVFGDGSYLEKRAQSDAAQPTRFVQADGGKRPEVVQRILESRTRSGQIEGREGVAVVVRLYPEARLEGLGLSFALRQRSDVLFADADRLRAELIMAGLALTFIVVAVAGAAARHLLEPLTEITRKLLAAPLDQANVTQAVDRVDEIGALARAFEQRSRALHESEARARLVLENASEGIITIDEQGRIESFNAACAQLFGYGSSEVVGQNVAMLMPTAGRAALDRQLRAFLERGARRADGARREMRGLHKDGSEFPVEVTVMSVELGGRRLITGIVRDIAERKTAEAERDRLIARLAASNEQLEAFAYVASHDLKAPLRVIDNASRWIEQDLEPYIDAESRENFDLLQGRVARMEKLLDDLLEYSRIGAKMDRRYAEIVRGDALLADVLALQPAPEGFAVEVARGFADILVNRMPLQQIFLNLIGNAIKHHESSTGRVSIDVRVEDGRYVFSVKDDGPGIPGEYHAQIFNMFQTLKPRDRVEGSGMGLAMVRKHVHLAGGEISVVSEEGNGSEFVFTWPVARPEARAELLETDGRDPEPQPGSRGPAGYAAAG